MCRMPPLAATALQTMRRSKVAATILAALLLVLLALGQGRTAPDADLYLCTCVPGGEEFEIYIVGLEREQ